MNIPRLPLALLKKVIVVALLIPTLGVFSFVRPTVAATLSELQQQQAALEQQAQAALDQANAKKTLAQRASENIQKVSSQIDQVQSSLSATKNDISSTQAQINDLDQQLAELQSQMAVIQNQKDAMLRQLYIMKESTPDDLLLFSNESVSAQAVQQQQFQDLQKYLTLTYSQFITSKQQVDSSRSALVLKSQSLTDLQSQQQDQQHTLASAKNSQQALQNNALVAVKQLEAQAVKAQAQAALIAQKVKLLISTRNWGGQIVSSNDSSWYYTQIGDYTHLGNSYATVNDSGCLITSIAMASTYYGHRISPDFMATNGGFSSQGYYYWGTPSSLRVNIQPSGAVNWSVVQNELSHNRPVIVSIYLPSVGAVNSDGSSHFIVIKGYSDGKYFMHDPIGDGRGYNLNQVRSMVLTSPK